MVQFWILRTNAGSAIAGNSGFLRGSRHLDCSAPGPATDVPAAPTAVPTAVPAATPAPPAEVAQFGTLNVAFKEMGIYTGNPSLTIAPANGYVTLATYENLLRRDINGKYFGLLVDSWTVGDDDLTWTFNLKKGVPFHDDVGEVTAEDVVWSILELGREGSTAAAVSQTRRIFGRTALEQSGDRVGHFIALDDYTVELKTDTPFYDVVVWINTPTTNGGWGRQ